MKELQIGIINNKQLADWFNISGSTFSRTKEERLKELEAYADFELIGNKQKKVKIIKVYQKYYHKKGSQAFETIKSKFDQNWSQTGLDSCNRVCDKIMKNTVLSIAPRTAYNYTLKSRNELYGKPFQSGGELGNCRYIWCKEEEGELRYLTPEEEEIKTNLIKKYFGDATEKQILVQGMVEAGEISKEQAWEVLTELTNMKGMNFVVFLQELQDKLGCRITKGTEIQKSAFSAIDMKK